MRTPGSSSTIPDAPLRPRLVAVADTEAVASGQSRRGVRLRDGRLGLARVDRARRRRCGQRVRPQLRAPRDGGRGGRGRQAHLGGEARRSRTSRTPREIAAAVQAAGRAVGGRVQLPQRSGSRACARDRRGGSDRPSRDGVGVPAGRLRGPSRWCTVVALRPGVLRHRGAGRPGQPRARPGQVRRGSGHRRRSRSSSRTRRRSSPSGRSPAARCRTSRLRRAASSDRSATRTRSLRCSASQSGARGSIESSRVAVGEQCTYGFEIRGHKGAVCWDFRRMQELQVCARTSTRTPPGRRRFVTPGMGISLPSSPGPG